MWVKLLYETKNRKKMTPNGYSSMVTVVTYGTKGQWLARAAV